MQEIQITTTQERTGRFVVHAGRHPDSGGVQSNRREAETGTAPRTRSLQSTRVPSRNGGYYSGGKPNAAAFLTWKMYPERREVRLGPIEYDILLRLSRGESSAAIAKAHNVVPKTIEVQRRRLREKIRVGSLLEMMFIFGRATIFVRA